MSCTMIAAPRKSDNLKQIRFDGPDAEVVRKRTRRANPLTVEQQDLAARYIPMAQSLAIPLKRDWPKLREEFDSAAMLALVEAARTFDPSRSIKFATYARFRIQGALRDVQREQLERKGLKIDQDEVPTIASLIPTMEEQGHVIGIQGQPDGSYDLEMAEAAERILSQLPRKNADACRLVFVEGLSKCEAARRMGISKTQLSYLCQQAVVLLSGVCGVGPDRTAPSDN